MFEYVTLVDAPVQRFTGIVTGADPDDDVRTLPPTVAPAPRLVPTPATPATSDPLPLTAPARPEPIPRQVAVTAPEVRMAQGAARDSSSAPSLVPALLAVAAAGLTAMWWLRRDSHDRLR